MRLWVVLFAVAFGTNVPTPLLLVYGQQLDLPPTALTGAFGVYAAGLVPSLLLAGPASDRRGRRAVTGPFVVLAAVSSMAFLPVAWWTSLLFVGRFLQGVVSGVVFSVGSAWMVELCGPQRPGVAARRVTVALSAGFALGPLSAGLLAQWVAAPTVLPYVVHLALLCVGLVAFVGVGETVGERRRGPLLNLGIPVGAGRTFVWFVLPAALCVFTFPSVSVTVLPLLLQEAMAGVDVAVTGVVAAVTMLTGVVVQPFGRRLTAASAAPVGVASGVVGLVISLVAWAVGAWALLVLVAVLLGAAYGLSLVAGLIATERIAAPEARGALTSSFYACAYLGFAAPLAVSLVATWVGFPRALAGLAVAGTLLAALLVAGPGRRELGARPEVAETAAGE